MFSSVLFVASTLANSFPASGPSWFSRRLQKRKQEAMSAKIQNSFCQRPWSQKRNDVLATNGRKTVLLNVLERAVRCQHLGKLLSCLWTELVVPKAAKKDAGGQCQQKLNVHFVMYPGVKKEMLFWQRMDKKTHFASVSLLFWINSRTPNVPTNSALVPEHSSLRPST